MSHAHPFFTRLSTAPAAAALLAACGGGGDDAAAALADRADSLEAPTAAAASIITLPPVRELEDGGTTTCANGSIGAVVIDTVFVPDGTTCQLEDTQLKGSILVGSRATLQANRVRVVGGLQAEGSRLVRIVDAGMTRNGPSFGKLSNSFSSNASPVREEMEPRSIGVSIHPGSTSAVRTPNRSNSRLSASVNPRTANFDAE